MADGLYERRSHLHDEPAGILATYGYDNANQLTSLAYTLNGNPVGDLTYTYVLAGQRMAMGGSWARTGLAQSLASATYDVANRSLTRGAQAFSYDHNGNLGSDGPTSYTWNRQIPSSKSQFANGLQTAKIFVPSCASWFLWDLGFGTWVLGFSTWPFAS